MKKCKKYCKVKKYSGNVLFFHDKKYFKFMSAFYNLMIID